MELADFLAVMGVLIVIGAVAWFFLWLDGRDDD